MVSATLFPSILLSESHPLFLTEFAGKLIIFSKIKLSREFPQEMRICVSFSKLLFRPAQIARRKLIANEAETG